MEYRTLGPSGLQVSAICFGTWAIGGRGWGEVDEAEGRAALRRAVDLGINFFDTADIYGHGHSEEVLGPQLRGVRDRVLIATKGGRRWDDGGNYRTDAGAAWLRRAIDDSLLRLGLDYVDLYQLHWPDPKVPVEESVGAADEIRRMGKARYIGVSNYGVEELKRALAVAPIVSNQIPLNMLCRENEVELLPFCAQQGVGVMAYGSLAQGLLTGKFSADHSFAPGDVRAQSALYRDEAFARNLVAVDALRPIAARLGRSVAQVAINWVLSHAEVTCAICGAKRPAQVEENVGGAGWALSAADLAEIAAILPASYQSPRPLS